MGLVHRTKWQIFITVNDARKALLWSDDSQGEWSWQKFDSIDGGFDEYKNPIESKVYFTDDEETSFVMVGQNEKKAFKISSNSDSRVGQL